MVANILPADPLPPPPPPTPTWGKGSKGQNKTFSGYGHVAYQIKENHECINMVANILPADPPPDPRVKRSKLNLFKTCYVAFQLNAIMKCSTIVVNILSANPSTRPTLVVKRSTINFFRAISCYISNLRESRMQQHGRKYLACRPPPPMSLGMGSKFKTQLYQNMVLLHIKLIGIMKCSNMVANILPTDPPDPRGMGQ